MVVASAVMRYWASAAGMVSAGVPVPVAKPVAETVAVQPAPKPRSSVTWTVPSPALRVPPGAAEPRLAVAGAVMESGPATTATVTVQPGLLDPGGQVLPGAVEVTVLDKAAAAGVGVVDGDGVGDGGGGAGGEVAGPGQDWGWRS